MESNNEKRNRIIAAIAALILIIGVVIAVVATSAGGSNSTTGQSTTSQEEADAASAADTDEGYYDPDSSSIAIGSTLSELQNRFNGCDATWITGGNTGYEPGSFYELGLSYSPSGTEASGECNYAISDPDYTQESGSDLTGRVTLFVLSEGTDMETFKSDLGSSLLTRYSPSEISDDIVVYEGDGFLVVDEEDLWTIDDLDSRMEGTTKISL